MATRLERMGERLLRFEQRQKQNWPSVTDPIIKPKPPVPVPVTRMRGDGDGSDAPGTKRNA